MCWCRVGVGHDTCPTPGHAVLHSNIPLSTFKLKCWCYIFHDYDHLLHQRHLTQSSLKLRLMLDIILLTV